MNASASRFEQSPVFDGMGSAGSALSSVSVESSAFSV
jgi:hypothetical protein